MYLMLMLLIRNKNLAVLCDLQICDRSLEGSLREGNPVPIIYTIDTIVPNFSLGHPIQNSPTTHFWDDPCQPSPAERERALPERTTRKLKIYIDIIVYRPIGSMYGIYDPGLAGAPHTTRTHLDPAPPLPPVDVDCGFSCGWEMSLHCLIIIDVEWSGAHSVVEHGWVRPHDHHKSSKEVLE